VHVVVRILESPEGSFHQHWHSLCVQSNLLRKMTGPRRVPIRRR
jgi:hypothetical protein